MAGGYFSIGVGEAGMTGTPRILVVRRENIGDLVCTTPLISSLRKRFPDAYIACLVNSYNADILRGNPDINAVYAYVKPRHGGNQSLWRSVVGLLRQFLRIRRDHFDYAILATTDFLVKDVRLLRLTGARHRVAIAQGNNPTQDIDIPVPYPAPPPRHIVEQLGVLMTAFGPAQTMPALRVYAAPSLVAMLEQRLGDGAPPIAVHISSRSPSQRWPAKHFVDFMRHLHTEYGYRFMLFWAPGSADNPFHPGDDEKAHEILAGLPETPVFPCPTERLDTLVAGISLCQGMVCSDGGAMHIAAGLGKPILCFFGNADPERWYPWHVQHELLRAESRLVSDISVHEAIAALVRLLGSMPHQR